MAEFLAHHRLRHFVVLLVLLGLSSPAHATPPGHDPAVQVLEAECVMAHASAYGDEEGKLDHKACHRLGLALVRGHYLGQAFTIDPDWELRTARAYVRYAARGGYVPARVILAGRYHVMVRSKRTMPTLPRPKFPLCHEAPGVFPCECAKLPCQP